MTGSNIDPPEVTTFVVTDIEADGPSPLASSMLSFASVACDVTGKVLDEFEVVLEPRSDRKPHPDTMAWWATQPEAWKAATANPERPETAMPRYADWVASLPGFHVFAAAPMIFDGLWMDHYLETFAGTRVFGIPIKDARHFIGLDTKSGVVNEQLPQLPQTMAWIETFANRFMTSGAAKLTAVDPVGEAPPHIAPFIAFEPHRRHQAAEAVG